jgi:hypothetical protein
MCESINKCAGTMENKLAMDHKVDGLETIKYPSKVKNPFSKFFI